MAVGGRGGIRLPRLVLATALAATAGCSGTRQPAGPAPADPLPSPADPLPSLAEAYAGSFRLGVALGPAQVRNWDEEGLHLAVHHFNSVTPENALKWERVHPEPGRYTFELADRTVELAEAHDMFLVGHVLVWHEQTPDWVFRGEDGGRVDRATLLARLRDHIHAVVGRYRGRIQAWDVVNEALAADGTLRPSPWLEIIGPDYIARAFEYAREADPDAELYYNDYSLANAPKREGAVRLVRRLQAEGVRVDGVGMQGHYLLDWPTIAQQDSTIRAFGALDVKVMITELDVDVLPRPFAREGADISARAEMVEGLDPYREGLPRSVQEALADRYAELFRLYVRHRDVIDRVTLWAVTDRTTWLNNWPVWGRTNHPMLFDRRGEPKPAFRAVLDAAPDGGADN